MKKVAVLGGGQLGMMMQEASEKLPLELHFLDPDPSCSARAVTSLVETGSFKDHDRVLEFCKDKDIVTVEIEHVNLSALHELEELGKEVYPQPALLEIIVDKGDQKEFFKRHGFPTSPFTLIETGSEISELDIRLPFVLKSRRGGYDGKGVMIMRSEDDLENAFEGPCLIEEIAPIAKELAVIVARDLNGDFKTFPAVEMDFDSELNLVRALFSPADIQESVAEEAKRIAEGIIDEMGLVGVLAVEFFLNKDGSLWVNEVAPRPHNSGHHTIEANITSQFEQHLRAISGMDLGETGLISPAAMINILGAQGSNGIPVLGNAELLQEEKGVFLHEYHKSETRPGRKMAHVTVLSDRTEKALDVALQLSSQLAYKTKETLS